MCRIHPLGRGYFFTRCATATAMVAMLAVAAGRADAQGLKSLPAEALLSAESVLFFRYDGYEPHRQAYDKTTLARIMKDDLGEFLDYLGTFARDLAIRELLRKGENLVPAKEREKAVIECQKFAEYFWRHGVAIGVEVDSEYLNQLRWPLHDAADPFSILAMRTTIVFPQGGLPTNRPVVFSFLKLLAAMVGQEINEKKEGTRTFFTSQNDRFVTWWQEGDHVVLRFGDEPVKKTIDVAEGRKPNLTATPLFKNLAAFKSYETDIRGLVNLEKIFDMVRKPAQQDRQLDMIADALQRHLFLHQLGANGVKGLTMHMGFSGKYQRRTVMLHVPDRGERTGLLKALTYSLPDPREFAIDKLPPLPPDASTVHVLHADWQALYNYADQTTKLLALAEALPQGRPPDNRFNLNAILNLDFRKDVLASLDSTVVVYRGHSEGLSFLGQGLAIKVKDAKKLLASGEIMNRVLIDSGLGMRMQKRVYRGVDMQVLNMAPLDANNSFLPVAPTYTVHKDWLVLGVFPQSVKGYILRSEGGRKVWQAPPYYQDLLTQCLKEGGSRSRLTGVSIIDQVPTFELGLSILPVVAQTLSSLPIGTRFDVSKIPNSRAITEFVYPSVRFQFDDGTVLRWESHFAVDFPVEIFMILLPFGVLGL